jgi:putative sterol carrier protein
MIRQILVDEIIRRFPDYLDAEAAAGISGVVGWELVALGNEVDRFTMIIEDGVIKIGQDLVAEPTVTLRLGVVSFLKLATGNGDPCTMVLSGDLELRGDAWFALALLGLIRIPATDGMVPLCGPATMDVRAVARLVREIPEHKLRERLRGPVRKILLDEIFRRMPEYLNRGRAVGVDAMIAWRITDPDGGHDEYRTLIRGGACTVVDDQPARVRLIVRTEPVVFLRLVTGNARPIATFLRRRIRIIGDPLLALRLPHIFTIPTG